VSQFKIEFFIKMSCQVELVETDLIIAFDKLRLTTIFKLRYYLKDGHR